MPLTRMLTVNDSWLRQINFWSNFPDIRHRSTPHCASLQCLCKSFVPRRLKACSACACASSRRMYFVQSRKSNIISAPMYRQWESSIQPDEHAFLVHQLPVDYMIFAIGLTLREDSSTVYEFLVFKSAILFISPSRSVSSPPHKHSLTSRLQRGNIW